MKVLLINPTIQGEPEAFHLGLVTVGTYLQQHSDTRVRILDFSFYRHEWQALLRRTLDEFEPDLVGMYVSSPFWPSAREVATEVKRLRPELSILAGGHHATLAPDTVIEHRDIDMLIVGEGEIPMLKLVQVLSGQSDDELSAVPGLWWREGSEIRKTEKGPPLDPLQIPAPNWDLYDERTQREFFYLWGILPVMGSRGCPYRCSFCAITNVQRLYKGQSFLRYRDPIAVVDEIEERYEKYKHLGLRIVYFYDLNFLIKTSWLKTFTEEYKRRGLNKKLPWSAYTRADHVNRLALSYLKDSGCVELRVGIEAANEYMRNDIYNKELTQQQLIEAVRGIKAAGISIIGYFLVGGPGDRPEFLQESLKFAYDEGIEYPTFFIYQPLEGTDVLQEAAEHGSFIDQESIQHTADFLRRPNMTHKHLTKRQIVAFRFLTQGVAAGGIIWHQVRHEKLEFVTNGVRYFLRAKRAAYTSYEAVVYYCFYGYDHLRRPPLHERRRKRSLPVKLLFKGLEAVWRSQGGEPLPESQGWRKKIRERREREVMDAVRAA